MSDRFDYETARGDLWEMGLDPDELPEKDSERRDDYLRRNRINPDRYKPGGSRGSSDTGRGGYGSSGTGGCFLTSACVHARNLPDDCEELQVLRRFRDVFMMATEEGKVEVQQYYEMTLSIVSAIEKSPNAEMIWEKLFSDVIVPAVTYVKGDRMDETYRLYRDCVLLLQGQYAVTHWC